MIIKLKPIFCLTQKKYLIGNFVFLGMCIFMALRLEHYRPALLITSFLLFLLSLPSAAKPFPKKLEITNGVIRYKELGSYSIGMVDNIVRYYKVAYEVWNISSICYAQNKIERLFGVGRVEFVGEAYFDAGKFTERYMQKYGIKEKHVFYGVPHFDQMQKSISAQFQTAEIKYRNE